MQRSSKTALAKVWVDESSVTVSRDIGWPNLTEKIWNYTKIKLQNYLTDKIEVKLISASVSKIVLHLQQPHYILAHAYRFG